MYFFLSLFSLRTNRFLSLLPLSGVRINEPILLNTLLYICLQYNYWHNYKLILFLICTWCTSCPRLSFFFFLNLNLCYRCDYTPESVPMLALSRLQPDFIMSPNNVSLEANTVSNSTVICSWSIISSIVSFTWARRSPGRSRTSEKTACRRYLLQVIDNKKHVFCDKSISHLILDSLQIKWWTNACLEISIALGCTCMCKH